MNKIVILFSLLILLTACSPEQQLNKIINEEVSYSTFKSNGLSVSYPLWPESENNDGSVEVSVTKGYCSVSINTEKMNAKQWYNSFLDTIEKTRLISTDQNKMSLSFYLNYQNMTLISQNQIYDCNDQAIVVTLTCIEQAKEKMQEMQEKIYDSVNCQEEDKKINYNQFNEEDFSVKYPSGENLEDTNDHIIAINKGVCSIIVDKHNALPKDIFNWVSNQQEELSSSVKNNQYFLTYPLSFKEQKLTANMKIIYCNYQSYLTQVICIDELTTNNEKEIIDFIFENSKCAKIYQIPEPVKQKEKVEEEEPEIIEDIEEEIVKTNVGEEFGIDEEVIVYFINNNDFFNRIMKDFPKANLVVEDTDRELKLRVLIDSSGKVTSLEDGEYSDANVTLFVPLRDALNIFNNAENINPLTLIGFAVNVRTSPQNIKNEIIQKVLRGEYS
jgi:hypothetical protein